MRKKYLSALIGMALLAVPYAVLGEGVDASQASTDSSVKSSKLADFVMDDLVITGYREKVVLCIMILHIVESVLMAQAV